jgi:hypothetical protein
VVGAAFDSFQGPAGVVFGVVVPGAQGVEVASKS